jgi:hypothetical protein
MQQLVSSYSSNRLQQLDANYMFFNFTFNTITINITYNHSQGIKIMHHAHHNCVNQLDYLENPIISTV